MGKKVMYTSPFLPLDGTIFHFSQPQNSVKTESTMNSNSMLLQKVELGNIYVLTLQIQHRKDALTDFLNEAQKWHIC